MKNKKKITVILVVAIAILLVGGVILGVVLHSNSPKRAVKTFHDSLLPDYDAIKLEESVGAKAYSIRFDDGGYFVDRYGRTREQIVYYYGEEFESSLSDFVVSDVGEAEKASIKKEYQTKYSLEIDEVKRVRFSVTLSSEHGKKSRTESLVTLKINGEWFVYDYDAYWFAYM